MRTLIPPVRVLVGDTAVGLPVVDLGNRAGACGCEPGLLHEADGERGGSDGVVAAPP